MNGFVRILLWPISILYGSVTWLRNVLFDTKVLKQTSFDEVKTICVGNLIAGGAGKTPHTEYLIRLLEKEYSLAALSRGYKRHTSGFLEVSVDTLPTRSGDEPLQIKQKFPNTMVAVDENRVKGIKKILEQKNVDIVLLDDAFQHRQLKCGLNILLTEYSNLFCNDMLLPAGRLREQKKGYLRADIIIVTKTPEHATPVDIRGVIKEINVRPYQSLYFSYIKYGTLYSIFDKTEIFNIPMHLYRYGVLLITGIANPQPLYTYIKEYAGGVIHQRFSDHHHFTQEDIKNIKEKFIQIEVENKIIITTEKDAMRLKSFESEWKDFPIFALPIEIDFKNKTTEFNEQIQKYVRANKIYHRRYS
ncbi:MAG: tetraacyldisaccharide 4'-kinase [Bacteroidetes bacterium]|nr:tetraacyldisaccharide 4'-kinase [Bacteroidota bacterium]